MPNSMMTLFPLTHMYLSGLESSFETGSRMAAAGKQLLESGFSAHEKRSDNGFKNPVLAFTGKSIETALDLLQKNTSDYAEYLRLFTDRPADQDWSFDYTAADVLLDLPGLRLIDISLDGDHRIKNYTVVFAPRAGHHSNIAERTARFMRDRGLTRMAVVEQKCASKIPLFIDGKRHYENFNGQVAQYSAVLDFLKKKTGVPPHLVAVCQPGPLLAATLILNPGLGKTFGSAGSPMHTEGEDGLLTDFARLMGKDYIDLLMNLFYQEVPEGEPGAGRRIYDGRLQVLGFYLLGMDQHMKNFRKAFSDIQNGRQDAYLRQKHFYEWYNYATHFPEGFIRDTYQKVFVDNQFIRGSLKINGTTVGINDYPGDVPVWALGGMKDDIAPPLQATGHVPLIDAVPEKDRLVLLADAGHMGLFRSRKVLESDYDRITRFILERSDR